MIVFKLCNFVVWEASVSLILFKKIEKYIFYLICFTRLLNIYIHVFYCTNYSQCLCIAQLSNNFFTLKLRCRLTWNLAFGKFRKGACLPIPFSLFCILLRIEIYRVTHKGCYFNDDLQLFKYSNFRTNFDFRIQYSRSMLWIKELMKEISL